MVNIIILALIISYCTFVVLHSLKKNHNAKKKGIALSCLGCSHLSSCKSHSCNNYLDVEKMIQKAENLLAEKSNIV